MDCVMRLKVERLKILKQVFGFEQALLRDSKAQGVDGDCCFVQKRQTAFWCTGFLTGTRPEPVVRRRACHAPLRMRAAVALN